MKIHILIFLIISIVILGCIPDSKRLHFNIDENVAMTIIKATSSINPNERRKIDELELSSAEVSTFVRNMSMAKEKRVAFVCCKYYLNIGSGRTIGLIINTKNKCIEAFDMGHKMDSIDVHSKSIRQIMVVKGIEQGQEMYNLIKDKFKGEKY